MNSIKLLIVFSSSFTFYHFVNGVEIRQPAQQRSQEHIQKCWRWGACSSSEEEQKALRVCYDKIDPKDIIDVVKTTTLYTFKKSEQYEIFAEFCSLEGNEELQDNLITEVGVTGVEYFTTYCANPFSTNACTIWSEMMDCIMDLIDKFLDEGKC